MLVTGLNPLITNFDILEAVNIIPKMWVDVQPDLPTVNQSQIFAAKYFLLRPNLLG